MKTRDITTNQTGGGGGSVNSLQLYKKERFLNVELLRFLFAVFILVFHYCMLIFSKFGNISNIIGKNSVTANGYLAVQYFFIIAGFFLIYTIKKNRSVMDFIKLKIARLWPLMAFNSIFMLIASGFGITKFNLYKHVLALLLLENLGVTFDHTIGGGWFVSVLFFVSIFYFYIFKYFDKKYYNFYIPILVVLGYTFMVHSTNGNIGGHIKTINYFFNVGIIQGVSAMGLGFIIHEFFRYIKKENYISSIKSAIIYTIIEGYLLGFTIYETICHRIHFKNHIILVIAFCGLFITFLLQRGYISKILNNKLSGILGRYAYSLFLVHGCAGTLFNFFYLNKHPQVLFNYPYLILGIATLIAFIFAIVIYHFIEVPAGRYLKKKFNIPST